MRKILLGTTAVVGAALLAPGAFAQPAATQVPSGGGAPTAGQAPLVPQTGTGGVAVQPTPAIAGAGGLTVRLGGYFAFTGGYIQDDWDRGRSRNGALPSNVANARSRTDFRNDMELNVFIDGRSSNGMTYGAVLEFQMDNLVTTAGDGTAVSLDEMYGFITMPNLGTIRFGQEDSAASLLQVRAPGASGLGGDGEWDEFIVQTGLADGSPYVISGINDGSDATKIIYLSPQFAGFDFGLSYAVNSGEGPRNNTGTSTTLIDRDNNGRQNEITAALRYRGNFSGVGVAAGFVLSHADVGRRDRVLPTIANRGTRTTITAYSAGATLSYQGFTFGGEYTFGNYRGASVGTGFTARGADMSWHYLLGASYTFNPVTLTANFGQGFQDGRRPTGAAVRDMRQTQFGVGASYTIAPGLLGYISYEYQRFRGWPGAATGSTVAGGNRTMQAVTIGTTLSF